MYRTFALVVVLLGLAGCGEPGGAREVPVSRRGDPGPAHRPSGPGVVTRPARAIATH